MFCGSANQSIAFSKWDEAIEVTTMDLNIAKFEIPIHIRKAFDHGKIDKVHEAMYLVTDNLAAIDARRYMATKPLEFCEEKVQEMKGANSKKTSRSSRVSKQIFSHRERRFKYHMDNMHRVLELYARSKIEANSE